MATLVFDIETVGEVWEDFDDTTKSALSRWLDRTTTSEVERDARLRDLQDGLGFSPLTGSIVAIGLFDVERDRGVVYIDTNGSGVDEIEEGNFIVRSSTESAMLQSFWENARDYDTFVTFNGRSFDAPFLSIRSLVHGVTPSRDLLEGRYLSQQKDALHIDLHDQLSFYGATHKRESLHLYCRALSIQSPKAYGVTGDDVATLFRAGRWEEIVKYNAGDVLATVELYKKWKTHLAPRILRERFLDDGFYDT